MAALPEPQRRDLALHAGGHSYTEIARTTGGRTYTNVAKTLRKANASIRWAQARDLPGAMNPGGAS